MRSGEEIQAALAGFASRWAEYTGGERAEAQTFLNELFACYGSDRGAVGARFEDFNASAGFMDLHWPGECIVEMKAPAKAVSSAREQVKHYWEESADEERGTPAARWVVLCNFAGFEIWEPGRFPKSPRATFTLAELPQRYEALMFLAGPALVPSFLEHHKELTAAAASTVAALYESLVDRSAAPLDEIQRFTLQTVWTLFAEDLGLLTGSPLQRTVERLRQDPTRSPAAEIGFLFRVLNQKTNHNRKDLLAGTRYVNGDLFRDPAEVDLGREELDLLAEAAERDWSRVDPTIFGSLMEGLLGHDRRWELGAHYTHEADILKIVGPTVVHPWQARIDAARTPAEALRLLEELARYVVLDPACGCGNFLYVAYRELRALEHQLKERITDLAASTGQPLPPGPWPYVPLSNLRGIDVEPVAVLIARVTLWMGHRQMIDRYGEAENPLPLVSLAGIAVADAVFAPWPECDVVIGNPPFIGDRLIRRALGDAYVERLRGAFDVGVVDYCAYWFRRTHEHLRPGQRAGLVSTNTLRENKHRLASLDHLVRTGGVITDAVSSQRWPGEAKVHVSITNWVKDPASPVTSFTLDGAPVDGITPQLREGVLRDEPVRLAPNKGVCFIGCQPTGRGFVLDDDATASLVAAGDGDVVRRYLTTDDITDSVGAGPRRWIIDFGTLTLEEALRYPRALAVVRRAVRPEREGRPELMRQWWQFWRPRPRMRAAVAGLDRYIACTLTGKRLLMVWADASWCPSNLVGVVARDDDYAMAVLASGVHRAWAWARSSTFETRLRYTPSTAFETFPWPTPDAAGRDAVAAAGRALVERRDQLAREAGIGLTELYNRVDDGAYTGLRDRQRELDVAVVAAYGWPAAVAGDDREVVHRLWQRNAQCSLADQVAPA
ncbi:DNA methyltransferase [Pseudokineococcus basanitobsidens]|uniref:site-specific DNA-methyltransferase (adenine-specific) n=1 Tax=Pseudokineococcus basanitobsidens TaxID=1926649 RepID=A0ABU8RL23_9ACTN